MAPAKGRSRRPGEPEIERATATDRAFLAMDTGAVPEQFGVILLLDPVGGFDLARARRLIAERVPTVPRLRQRLIRPPFGCGGPIWLDDPGFDIARHVRVVACPAPEDEQALLDCAVSLVSTRLPWSAPLWSAVFVTGVAEDKMALVVVLHHALADGLGGLAVLTRLLDAPAAAPRAGFPRPAPTAGRLARDAWVGRLRALRGAGQSIGLLRASMGAGGGLWPPRAVRCSLNQRTGRLRRLAVVRADVAAVRASAHRHGATVNDAVLVAAAGALHHLLLRRGERVDTLVITVPVSGRDPGIGPTLGNMVSPMLVSVPATGTVPERLAQVSAQVRAHRAAASGPPPIALLGWLFRPLAALGGFHWYMNHQHRFHSLVTHVRGPTRQVTFAGSPITSAVPVSVGAGGNATVYFEVLSYAGTLVITATVDPEVVPDLDSLTAALRAELDLIIRQPPPGR